MKTNLKNEKYLSSLEQTSRTGNLDTNLILREHNLDSMARCNEIKSINSNLRRKEKATEIGQSSSLLQS